PIAIPSPDARDRRCEGWQTGARSLLELCDSSARILNDAVDMPQSFRRLDRRGKISNSIEIASDVIRCERRALKADAFALHDRKTGNGAGPGEKRGARRRITAYQPNCSR